MTQDKKPGFWGRLFGEKPQPKSDTEEALERATGESRGEEEALAALRTERAAQATEPEPTPAPAPEDEDSRDAAPPEMQAEWLERGHPNPPEHEPPTPDDVTDPLERPDALDAKALPDPEEPAAEPEPVVPSVADEPAQPQSIRQVIFDDAAHETNIYWRDELPCGAQIIGPAVIQQLDSTTLIPPGVQAKIDLYMNIIISV